MPFLAIITLVALCLLTGCATYRPMDFAEIDRMGWALRKGDVITCRTHLGKTHDFTVVAVERGWIWGDAGESVFLRDIDRLTVWRHAGGDRALRVAGVLATAGLVSAAANSVMLPPAIAPSFGTAAVKPSQREQARQDGTAALLALAAIAVLIVASNPPLGAFAAP